MRIVVISGKGGTGKTTVTASYAHLSQSMTVKVDCDVDASNLHLMFPTKVHERYGFKGAKKAVVEDWNCSLCGRCISSCKFEALSMNDKVIVSDLLCEGCGACRYACPSDAIRLEAVTTGDVILSEMPNGLISRAEMIPGEEGSGKLVSEVRKQADRSERDHQLLDGSPGIGCSVIASITGTDVGVVVTEPTQSGLEDMKRVLALMKHFDVVPYVLINKYDINEDIVRAIETLCLGEKIEIIGKVPFDSKVNLAINQGTPIVAFKDSVAGRAIEKSFYKLKERILS